MPSFLLYRKCVLWSKILCEIGTIISAWLNSYKIELK